MFIYKTTNLLNGKYYIGKYAGKRSTYLGSGIHLKSALEKYGRKNFKRIILEECNSLEQLSDREKYWIELFDAVKDPRSYNLTEGGQGGFSHITQENLQLRSNNRYGKKPNKPKNAVDSNYRQVYVVWVGTDVELITGMENVEKYLDMTRSQIYVYFDLEIPKKGYRFKSLLVDHYTEYHYLIEGVHYKNGEDIRKKFNISTGVLTHRCLKSERMDWWKIVEVKEKWKKL